MDQPTQPGSGGPTGSNSPVIATVAKITKTTAWKVETWIRGLIAAAITGAAGGILTGFAAMGIAPDRFNFTTGVSQMFKMTMAAAGINAIIGVAAYLQKSPLPLLDGVDDVSR